MALVRKVYGDLVGETIRDRIANRLAASLGLKVVQQGNFYTLPAGDLDTGLPAVLVDLEQVEIGTGKPELQMRAVGVDYRLRIHYLVRLAVGAEHQRVVAQGLEAVVNEFLREGLDLALNAPGLSIRKVLATGYSVGAPEEFEEIEEAVGHGTVDLLVDAESLPFEE